MRVAKQLGLQRLKIASGVLDKFIPTEDLDLFKKTVAAKLPKNARITNKYLLQVGSAKAPCLLIQIIKEKDLSSNKPSFVFVINDNLLMRHSFPPKNIKNTDINTLLNEVREKTIRPQLKQQFPKYGDISIQILSFVQDVGSALDAAIYIEEDEQNPLLQHDQTSSLQPKPQEEIQTSVASPEEEENIETQTEKFFKKDLDTPGFINEVSKMIGEDTRINEETFEIQSGSVRVPCLTLCVTRSEGQANVCIVLDNDLVRNFYPEEVKKQDFSRLMVRMCEEKIRPQLSQNPVLDRVPIFPIRTNIDVARAVIAAQSLLLAEADETEASSSSPANYNDFTKEEFEIFLKTKLGSEGVKISSVFSTQFHEKALPCVLAEKQDDKSLVFIVSDAGLIKDAQDKTQLMKEIKEAVRTQILSLFKDERSSIIPIEILTKGNVSVTLENIIDAARPLPPLPKKIEIPSNVKIPGKNEQLEIFDEPGKNVIKQVPSYFEVEDEEHNKLPCHIVTIRLPVEKDPIRYCILAKTKSGAMLSPLLLSTIRGHLRANYDDRTNERQMRAFSELPIYPSVKEVISYGLNQNEAKPVLVQKILNFDEFVTNSALVLHHLMNLALVVISINQELDIAIEKSLSIKQDLENRYPDPSKRPLDIQQKLKNLYPNPDPDKRPLICEVRRGTYLNEFLSEQRQINLAAALEHAIECFTDAIFKVYYQPQINYDGLTRLISPNLAAAEVFQQWKEKAICLRTFEQVKAIIRLTREINEWYGIKLIECTKKHETLPPKVTGLKRTMTGLDISDSKTREEARTFEFETFLKNPFSRPSATVSTWINSQLILNLEDENDDQGGKFNLFQICQEKGWKLDPNFMNVGKQES